LGGLPLAFMDEQVKKICETFGRLKFFNLVKEGNVSKGYCFFEYDEHKNAEKAIKALNSLPIGDKRLKCHAATLANKGLSLSFTPASNLNTGLN
jgi:RNA recognition motif-containing protein